MRWIIACLVLLLLAGAIAAFLVNAYGFLSSSGALLAYCTLSGMAAGILYCLRAVYVNTGMGRWNAQWEVWYFLRPITSAVSGFASYLFLQAGLLALSATPDTDGIPYGYVAVAFIAGYNVDFFMRKIEHVAQQLWGIEKSRASRDADETDSQNHGQEEDQ